jgi:bacitracin synthase 1
MYGPTEATIIAAVLEIERDRDDDYARLTSVPIGFPTANNQLLILDPYLHLCPIRVTGELYISGTGVAAGYVNQPDLTGKKFLENPYATSVFPFQYIYRSGDLCRWLNDGSIEFIGRIDNQVKIRGFRIELGEIENHLLAHPEVRDAVVVDQEKPGTQEKFLCAYFVPEKTGTKIQPEVLGEFLSLKLPDYMVPAYFIEITNIPLNPNGKVDRNALPGPDFEKTTLMYMAPRDETEKKLARLWEEILGRPAGSIGIDDNFFHLGGHSLKGMVLISRMHKDSDVKLTLADLFKTPTIRALSDSLRAKVKDKFVFIPRGEKKEYYLLSSAQKRLYILDQLEPGSINYNIPMVYRVPTEPDQRLLADSFWEIIERHESFRTSFIMVGHEPKQHILPIDQVEFKIEFYDRPCPASQTGQASQIELIIKEFIRPFDLTRAPLLRVGWLDTGDGDHFLLIDMHHIISDGVSMEIFHQELARVYRLESLAPLRLQYRDYAEWQNSGPEKEKKKKQEEFWLKEFSGEIPVLNLPLDFPRPAMQSSRGDSVSFELNPEETRTLNKWAREQEITLFMVLLAILDVLLAKLSGQEDTVIGTPTAGRRHADLEPVIGMFVNTLPLRHFPAGQKRFDDFSKEAWQKTMQAFENQEYPFEQLLELPGLEITRDTSRNPLFDVMFALQNQAGAPMEKTGLELIPYVYERKQAKFDMTLGAVEEKGGLTFEWEYCSDLFEEQTVERFIGYFRNLVASVIGNPGIEIRQMDVMSGEERERILGEFNRLEPVYRQDGTIPGLFLEQVQRTPDCLALKGGRLENLLSYRELADRAGLLATDLRARGVGSNVMVGVMADRGVEIIIGILGILLAGGAYVPLNPKAPEARNRFIMADTGAEIVIGPQAAERSAAAIPGTGMLNRIAESPQFVKPQAKLSTVLAGSEGDCCVSSAHGFPVSSDLAYVIYTSGSTGQPKGVPISHANLSPLLHWGYRHLNLGSRDRTIQNLSYYFDWSVWEIFITLTSGACLYTVAEELMLNADAAADFMQKHDITVLHSTPTQFLYLLATGRVFPTLKYLCLGAEKLTHDLVKRSFSLVSPGCRIYNMYGPTEATIIAAVLEIERDRDDD